MHESTILITDDELASRTLLKMLLSREGYNLAFASNGAEAIAKATEAPPDLILLDIMMPGMDGFEVCRRLRADPLLSTVPIVIVTALDDRNSRSKGIEAGADGFVSKPFDHIELQERVRTIVRLNRYRLLRERAKFEQLVELSPNGIVIVNTNGLIDLANPTILQMLGAKKQDLVIGKNILTFVIPEQVEYCSTFLHDTITGTIQSAKTETWLVRLNGEHFPVEISAGHMVWNGELAAQITVTDITERKRAEESLRRYANEQSVLYAVASVATTLLTPKKLLSAVLDAVLPTLDTDIGWATLSSSTSDEPPYIVAWCGVSKSFLEAWKTASLYSCPLCTSHPIDENTHVKLTPIVKCPHVPTETLTSVDLDNYVCVPLHAGDRILGALNVAWSTPRPHPQADYDLLMTIGQQVGLALQNTQLYQAARQVDQLQVLNELDQALAATLDPEKAAEITLQHIAAALDMPIGTLFILPPQLNTHFTQMDTQELWIDPQKVQPVSQKVLMVPQEMRTFSLEQGWIEITTSEETTQRLQNLLEQTSKGQNPILLASNELAKEWTPYNLAIPIWIDQDLTAILTLGGRAANRPLTDEDLALTQAAASHAGQAIQNARLYQASQQQSDRLSTLHAISTATVSSLELDTVLHKVLELTCQALNATAGSVLMSDPDTGKMIFVLTLPEEMSALHSHQLLPGQGIAGWVAQHGRAVRVNDVNHDTRWYDGMDQITGLETRSVLCAPMKHYEKITGVIEIVNKRDGQFTKEDLSLLEAISFIAATALENARLYTTTRSRAAELARLNEVGLALTSTLDFSTVVHAALSQIQRLFQAEHVSLLQPDPQTDELCFVQAMVGRTPVEIPVRLPPGKGIAGWALEQRQPVLVDDARTDPRSLEWIHPYIGTQVGGLMAVPLLAREQDIGVIEVSSNEPGAYTNNELRTLQAVASTLSMALENAGLYDELKTLLHEREQAQAQLIHAEKMTALGRLTASIAHEINNPLQAMQTYLILAQEEFDSDQRPEKVTRYLGTVGDEIERIAAIVRRMRDFYLPARKELQPIYLHAVLESVLELTNKQLQHSNITVERAWVDYLPEIQANPDHLKQVFLNLMLNGIDAMATGGTLYISTAVDQIQLGSDQKPLPAVRAEFSDTGEGIPPEVLPHIFEPFFTTKERGSGLGLSISYGIIQAHNGQITVESHIGLGTTFAILLPVEQPLNG
ncbi:MAG: GAF domain-containing protein [Chloroflexi bacterium]|nr:GAF domain-containing protein [Chloroflexota bacterium]